MMHYKRLTHCSDCNEEFLSTNPRTHRCTDCRAKPKKQTFNRTCCICSTDFVTRNIYTVCCSQACGKQGALTGKAKASKAELKRQNKLKREQSSLHKELKRHAYEESLWTKERVLEFCLDNWGDNYQYVIPDNGGYKCEITVVCEEHGESTLRINPGETPSTPCRECRTSPNPFGSFNPTTVSRFPDEIITLYVVKHSQGYKVGLSRNVDNRMKSIFQNLEGASLLHTIEGRLEDMFKLEQELIEKCGRDESVNKFGGYTECVVKNPLEFLEVGYEYN